MYVSQSKKDSLIACLICSIGGTVFGYDLGALSAVSQSLRSEFSLGPSTYGFTIAASLWGTVAGSMFAGYVAVYFGRRTLIASCALIYAMATTAIALFGPAAWGIVLALRFLCGIAIGGFTVGCPLYLAQIAPSDQRGQFVAWFQVQVGIGVVLGFAIGYVAAHLGPLTLYWRACFGFGAIPPVVLLLFLNRMPEEAHLFDRNSSDYQEKGLEGPSKHKFLLNMRTGTGGDGKLFRRKNVRPLLLATAIALFNQLSGVNILLLYLLDILSNTGANFLQSHRSTLAIAILGLLPTVGGMAFVDKLGRKPLLISGAGGMSICLFVLSAPFKNHISLVECLAILITYNTCFAFSQGTVIWVYLSEIFPFDVRAKGQSYGASVLWISNAALITLFPTLQHFSPEWSLRFFSLMMLLQIVIALLWYPETKAVAVKQGTEAQANKLSIS